MPGPGRPLNTIIRWPPEPNPPFPSVLPDGTRQLQNGGTLCCSHCPNAPILLQCSALTFAVYCTQCKHPLPLQPPLVLPLRPLPPTAVELWAGRLEKLHAGGWVRCRDCGSTYMEMDVTMDVGRGPVWTLFCHRCGTLPWMQPGRESMCIMSWHRVLILWHAMSKPCNMTSWGITFAYLLASHWPPTGQPLAANGQPLVAHSAQQHFFNGVPNVIDVWQVGAGFAKQSLPNVEKQKELQKHISSRTCFTSSWAMVYSWVWKNTCSMTY